MVKARKWILAKQFDGFPKESDLKLVEEELPEVQDGGVDILIEAVYLSVDPYMRAYSNRLEEGDVMMGGQVARVTESRDSTYPVGTYLILMVGWRNKTIINPCIYLGNPTAWIRKVPNFGDDIPKSMFLGALGLTGLTAYFGLLSILEPKAGEVVLVSTAAGAVGSIVGQIAKIKGCIVIGSSGSDDKVKWIRDELGFDFAFNYKTCDLSETLKKMAPDGIDCYFDNVGGTFTQVVMRDHMKPFGRISVCGAISHYNDQEQNIVAFPPMVVFTKQLKIEGFIVTRWQTEYPEATKVLHGWLNEGKIKHKEDITNGFENMPKAFFAMLQGKNTGKAVIKV